MPILETMAEIEFCFLYTGEVTDKEVDIFDEKAFIDEKLSFIVKFCLSKNSYRTHNHQEATVRKR